MSAALEHRGPDDQGQYIAPKVALGARRLSIVDVEGGHQPIANEDGSLWVVLNGEIYNHRNLRSELERRGHQFRTQSDTEVIVHAFEEFGPECPRHLSGMFAFAVWDARKDRLFLARDRFGQKPLYYASEGGTFAFASELKALLRIPTLPREIDEEALYHYLSLQYVPEPWSIFKSIRKLPPAHWMLFEKGQLRSERYWTLDFEPKLAIDQQQAVEELERLMTQAVRRRLMSEVPLGAFLSGGLDSSIVVALMAELTSSPVQTFSIGFEFGSMNELPHARQVADHFATDHHELIVTAERFDEILPKLTDALDEPFADSSSYQTYLLAKEARQQITVALNGDGGDECFVGYPRYWLDRWVRPYTALPSLLTQTVVPGIVDRLPEPNQLIIEANWILGLKRLSQVARGTPKASILRWGSFFDDDSKGKLLVPEVRARLAGSNTSELLAKDFDEAQARTNLDRTLAVDTARYLCGDILVKTDRMTMAHSLEARSPFLDHELFEFAARLPTRLKLRGRQGKYLLRRTFADRLPPTITKRPKRGFGAPIEAWSRAELRPLIEDMLLSQSAALHEFVSVPYLKELVVDHVGMKRDNGRRIWALLMLESWLQNLSRT